MTTLAHLDSFRDDYHHKKKAQSIRNGVTKARHELYHLKLLYHDSKAAVEAADSALCSEDFIGSRDGFIEAMRLKQRLMQEFEYMQFSVVDQTVYIQELEEELAELQRRKGKVVA
jgi:hypothetical protein